ncbi:DEAD/DEAH box helicase [Cellulophaga sp. Hel_I_12]|uniref:DEAD/DEAH box helicase n=1 Tax=Cellulophaga sp. Hel_I_12 TaxID=1249972 RepID=UPI000646A962|nr:DEAD/DEAH box helicase family protein [Cellulophaga sp. Hel_I_12]
MKQTAFEFQYELDINLLKPLYFKYYKNKIGAVSQLGFPKGRWKINAAHQNGETFKIGNEHFSFVANCKKLKDFYEIKSILNQVHSDYRGQLDSVKIDGIGKNNMSLRAAQKGAVYSLLSHWSISTDPATIVLPTGTGKTETMIVTTLAEKAKRTLVIVPTIDLKNQIAEKFESWGMLRELGVIPEYFQNPTVCVLKKTLNEIKQIEHLEKADVVISTPALISKAPIEILEALKPLFSHVFFDEAHHVKANSWESIKTLFNHSKIVQFTATPYRNDRRPIDGKFVYNYPLSQALTDNCFSEISLISVDEKHPQKKDEAIARAAMSRLLTDRECGYVEHCMMVRANNHIQSEELFKKYKEWFPKEKIVLIHSKIDNKREEVQKIKARQYNIIVCVDMLSEGFDFPELKIAAVHGIHKSLSVILQFIGRFTRPKKGLGKASFVVNYADEKISVELENLFQEGTGWEKVISEIADAKKEEAESLLNFLQGCKPLSGFDSHDVQLNPKLVFPALSCVCYKCEKVEWRNFSLAFNLNKYKLSQPYINEDEGIFYFTTQTIEKVKWAKVDSLKDQTWNLIVMHFDKNSNLLYIGYSEKRLDHNILVSKISDQEKPDIINGDEVFRSFDSISRLSIVHAGVFKPASHLHRYSRLSGSDVTTELKRWKEGNKVKKSDFVGVGFRNGHPESIGASVKGKIWSPARIGNVMEWKKWCLKIGALVTDRTIDSNQLLVDSADKTELKVYDDSTIILATDWSEELYEKIHRIEIKKKGSVSSFLISECTLNNSSLEKEKANFSVTMPEGEVILFSITLGGENGFNIIGLDNSKYYVEGLKAEGIPLKEFFERNPPTMFLLNGDTIAGCILTEYKDSFIVAIPSERIENLSWEKVDYTVESMYKNGSKRDNSIQEYMMKILVERGARIVFNDDNSGEKADIIAIFMDLDIVRFELIHCKYSKEKAGARKSDLYEVCGQAIISLRYKWKPEELLKHMERRNGDGVLKGKRFYLGNKEDLDVVKKALKYSDVKFEFAIAQPGVETPLLTLDMKNFLGSIFSTVIEMTETELKCYFNK